MKYVDHVQVTLRSPDDTAASSQTFNGATAFEEVCTWLLGHGVYDEISLKKTLTVEKEVAARLKG